MGLNSMSIVFIRRERHKETHREKDVTTKKEMGVTHLQARDCLEPPEAREAREDSSLEPSQGEQEPDALIQDLQDPEP